MAGGGGVAGWRQWWRGGVGGTMKGNVEMGRVEEGKIVPEEGMRANLLWERMGKTGKVYIVVYKKRCER